MLRDELHLVENGRVVYRPTEVARRRSIEIEIHRQLELERLRFFSLPFVHAENAGKRERNFGKIDPIGGFAGHLQSSRAAHYPGRQGELARTFPNRRNTPARPDCRLAPAAEGRRAARNHLNALS